jgi:hypothetical protein
MRILFQIIFLTFVCTVGMSAPQTDPSLDNIIISKPQDLSLVESYTSNNAPLYLLNQNFAITTGVITGKYHEDKTDSPVRLGFQFSLFTSVKNAHVFAVEMVGTQMLGLQYLRRLVFDEETDFRKSLLVGFYNSIKSEDGIAGFVNFNNTQLQVGAQLEWKVLPISNMFPAESFATQALLSVGTKGTATHLGVLYSWSWR